jgi:hypothetical protein
MANNIDRFLARQHSGGRASPRKQMTDFGYSREAMMREEKIARYVSHYKIPEEMTRNTGVPSK